jgi:Putative Ig domain
MNTPCQLVLKDCTPCDDSPIANLSAEAPDVDVFIAFRDFRGNPPLGVVYAQLGCKAICFSTVSQRDADDCAVRRAQECVWPNWKPPGPPRPPGPDDGPGGPTPNTPGGVPPSHPSNPISTAANTPQICSADCPDGSPFSEIVPAGTVVSLNQNLANAMAHSLACNRALEDRICFASGSPPAACVGQAYSFQVVAVGGQPFDDRDYEWSETGDFPPGLSLNSATGLISGTPFVNGSFSFGVRATDADGNSQNTTFSICVMEIVTGATLPPATEATPYAAPLIQEPGTVSSEQWSLVSGILPPGITLAANGALSGTPTEINIFTFELQVTADCGGSSVTCIKGFTLEVLSLLCGTQPQAIEDAVWTEIFPFSGIISMSGGDGTIHGGPNLGGLFGEVTTQICNPHAAAYDFTVQVDWTIAGFGGLQSSGGAIRLNAADHDMGAHAGNGTFTFSITLSLPSGVNTLNIYFAYGGIGIGTAAGTITIRPLTPP